MDWTLSSLVLLESSFKIHSCLCIANKDMKVTVSRHVTSLFAVCNLSQQETSCYLQCHCFSYCSLGINYEHLEKKSEHAVYKTRLHMEFQFVLYATQFPSFNTSFHNFYAAVPKITNEVRESFYIAQRGKLLPESRNSRRNHNIRQARSCEWKRVLLSGDE